MSNKTRKFKLIKEYPGSPSLGTEVNYSEKHNVYNYNGGSPGTEFSRGEVEYFSEFWEEIKTETKNFKVLMYRNIHSSSIVLASKILDTNNFEIFKIKRLPDGKIFSIGDKIKGLRDKGKITGIFVCKNRYNEISAEYGYDLNSIGKVFFCINDNFIGTISLEDAEYIKEPLTVSEDDFPIYEGNEVYKVKKISYGNYVFHPIKFQPPVIYKNGDLYFTKKTNAEKWVKQNKIKWSDNDVIDFTSYYMGIVKDSLRQEFLGFTIPEPDIGDTLENYKNQK